ncbi:MAG: hypothetical protein HGB10_03645 [Coriobacteriia bacterium]|nr:hypothetical protein [Coriobacteriia bacterium]
MSPAGATSVTEGTSQAYTITPAAGYQIANVTVDGTSVGAVSTYTFSNVTAPHTISASFTPVTVIGSEMPVTYVNCDSCHIPGSALDEHEHPCANCHEVSWGHAGTPSDMHTNAVASTCVPCHNAEITIEHNGRTISTGALMTCATCHDTTDPLVRAAINAGNSECAACHPGADHESLHAFTGASDLNAAGDSGCTNSGAGCHGTDATHASFTPYHPTAGCLFGACHASPSKPGYAGTKECVSCHDGSYVGAPNTANLGSLHYSAGVHTAIAMTATVTSGGSASATCSNCHDAASGLVGQHTGVSAVAGSPYGTTVSCGECHSDTRASGSAQVVANWTSRQCAACHAPASSAPQHATTAPVVTATSTAGCAASGSGCHATADLHSLHKNASGCAITGCHNYGAQAEKPTIKTCGQAGGCHLVDGTDFHTGIATAHTSPSVGSCFGCHPASRSLIDAHALYAGAGSERPQYATVCALCHNNDNPSRINWTTATARCTTCHPAYHGAPAGTEKIHSNRDTAHTPTAASTECTGCHEGWLTEIHSDRMYTSPTDCVSCHAVHPDPSCARCHSQISNWNKTADCAGCHTAGGFHPGITGDDATHTATPFTALAQGTGVDGPVPAGGKECSACHSATLLTAHATTTASGGSVTCVECHSDTTLGSKAVIAAGWANSRCTDCHDTGTATAHNAYSTAHTVSTTRGCAGSTARCHDYTDLALLHEKSQSGGAFTASSCANTGCHTTMDARPATVGADSCGTDSTGGCHADKTTTNHGYDAEQHAGSVTDTMTGTWTMALLPTQMHAGQLVNPAYAYGTACSSCHSGDLATEHGKTTSAPDNALVCADCHPSPRSDVVGVWDKSCATSGCHSVAGRQQHSAEATLAPHAVDETLKVSAPTGLGCSVTPGGAGYERTTCHTTDLVQEHNRKIGGWDTALTPRIERALSVTCEECHTSAKFAALSGTWDGTCGSCHDDSHAVVGSARYTAVRARHEASRPFDAGRVSRTGTQIAGTNAMDAHGQVRTAPAGTEIPYGCALQMCHIQFYVEAGLSSYYPAGKCANCHGANTIPMPAYEGSYMWKSGIGNDGEYIETSLTLAVPGTLPAASYLDFKTLYDIELGWDYGYVQVSTDSGQTWTPLANGMTTNENPSGQNIGNGITGVSDGWVDARFDLAAYAGQSIQLRFDYVTDAYTYGEGWYIDSIAVGPEGARVFTDYVETLAPEWTIGVGPSVGWSR